MDSKNSEIQPKKQIVPIQNLTQQLAVELGRYAERPVQVVLCGGGFSEEKFGDSPSAKTLTIDMNPAALNGIRKADQAATVWNAMGFYRLINQINDAVSQSDSAKETGMGNLFRVLNDEHNQRKVASVNPQLGATLQTLCAHVYRSNTPNFGLVVGTTNSTSGGAAGYEAEKAYQKRLGEFAYRLRRGLKPSQSTAAEVVEALNLVPENFKTFMKTEVLDLASSIQAVLTKGLELPKESVKLTKVATVSAVEEPEFEFTDDDEAEAELELADIVSPTDKRWWQLLFRSKWSYIVLGSFVMGWLAIMMKAGLEFWTGVACMVIFVAVVAGAFGFASLFSHKSERSPSTWTWKGVFAKIFSTSWLPFSINWKWRPGSWVPFKIEWQAAGLKKILAVPGVVWRGLVKHVFVPIKDFIVASGRAFKNRVSEILIAVHDFCESVVKSKASRYFFGGIARFAVGFKDWTVRLFILLWRHSTFRLFVLALPIAILAAVTWAMASMGAELMLWQLVVVGVIWLIVIALSYYYAPQFKAWVIVDARSAGHEVDGHVAIRLPVDKTTTTFEQIVRFEAVDADSVFFAGVKEKVVAAAQPLKDSLKRCGFVTRDRNNMSEGFDLIDEIEMIEYTGETDIFVGEVEKERTSLRVDVVVDCSNSQNDATDSLRKGEKFLRSKAFALAIEEAIRGKKGVSGGFWGYDNDTIYDCGNAGDCKASGLKISSAGNNDAGALFHVTQNVGSDKSKRVVILVSDAQPADCSWGALHELGYTLLRQGVIVVQVLTEACDDPALSWHVVDIYSQSLANASAFLGRILEGQLFGR